MSASSTADSRGVGASGGERLEGDLHHERTSDVGIGADGGELGTNGEAPLNEVPLEGECEGDAEGAAVAGAGVAGGATAARETAGVSGTARSSDEAALAGSALWSS